MMTALAPPRLKLLIASLIVAVVTMVISPTTQAQGCSGDTNGDGRVDGTDLATVLGQWGNCPPSITSVSPTQGSVLGGTVITITGTGLAATSGVTVGGTACTNLVVLSPTQVRATTPPGTVGPASITLTTPAGMGLASTPFYYAMQSVTSIVPPYGRFSGGTTITITGQYLAGVTAVTVGGVPATNVVALNPTTVTAVTPAGSVGEVDVVVSGPKGTLTIVGGFTYLTVQVPPWATLIEATPDPTVVTDESLRASISATEWAWRVRDNGTGIEMLMIPPGTFDMGCSPSDTWGCAFDGRESPVHAVTLTSAFYLGRFEVTQAQWTAKMVSNPSDFQGQADSSSRPVEKVSWNIIQGFLASTGMRLPTEAEWEYAYRAGTTKAFHGWAGQPTGTNDDSLVGEIAWYTSNSNSQTHPIGEKAANGFGLHDMAGNVWEWVNDLYGAAYYASSPSTNPPGPTTGTSRVLRGGTWTSPPAYLRASDRLGASPGTAVGYIGFRVARNP